MSIVAEIKRRRRRGGARVGARARRRRAGARRSRARAAAARGAARRSPTACGAGTRRSGRPTSRSRSSPACCSSGAGCRSRPSASTSRATSSRRSSCARCRRRSPACERIVVCTPPAGAGLVAAAAELLGIDEVWALGGPQAIGWLAYVAQRRQDRRPRQLLRERGEARGAARRRDRPARRPVRGRRASRSATSTRGSSSSSSPRRPSTGRTRSAASSRRSPRPRRSRPSTSCCSATAEALRRAGAKRGRRLRRAVLAGRRRRLRDRRQSRPADGRLGALGRRARDRDVPEAGDDAAADRGGARAAPADGRGARRGRGDAGARRGGAAMRALSPEFQRLHLGAADATRSRGSPGSTRRRSCASTRTRRRCRCRATRPGAIARRARVASTATRPAATRAARARSPTTTASSPENVVLGAGADDLILLCARAFAGPGRHDRDPGGADLPALPDRGAARGRRGRRRRPGAHVHLPARTAPTGRCAPLPEARPLVCRRGVLRVLRRDRASRCSTTA